MYLASTLFYALQGKESPRCPRAISLFFLPASIPSEIKTINPAEPPAEIYDVDVAEWNTTVSRRWQNSMVRIIISIDKDFSKLSRDHFEFLLRKLEHKKFKIPNEMKEVLKIIKWNEDPKSVEFKKVQNDLNFLGLKNRWI